jgi:hypothetical protein
VESADLKALGNSGLDSYVESLYKAEQEMPWAGKISADLLRDYVVPVRFNPSKNAPNGYYYPEKIENWRAPLYASAKVIVGSTSNPATAAKSLHKWVNENIPYLAQNQPRYLQPTLILDKRGGSCWHSAILLAAFYRSVFLPARVVVAASYWSETAAATGTAVAGKDLEIVVMKKFWISRDWQIWDKEFQVLDKTSNVYLGANDYSTSIKTIDAAGREQLVLKIPASKASNHSFRVTFRYAYPQGHEWVEVWIPDKGWMSADGTDQTGLNVGLALWQGFFDMQACNPSRRVWVSSYFFYRFSEPVESLLTITKTIVGDAAAKGYDVALARSKLTQAEQYYKSVKGKSLSYEDRQKAGEYVYKLCGASALLALSNDPKSVFLSISEVTPNNPASLASTLASNKTSSVGAILPYNVFDLPRVRQLYAPKGNDPPYVNEVKREYNWLDAFRSSLAKGTRIYALILGYDPVAKQWKMTLTRADRSKPLESTPPELVWTRQSTTSVMFKIGGSESSSSNSMMNDTPSVSVLFRQTLLSQVDRFESIGSSTSGNTRDCLGRLRHEDL